MPPLKNTRLERFAQALLLSTSPSRFPSEAGHIVGYAPSTARSMAARPDVKARVEELKQLSAAITINTVNKRLEIQAIAISEINPAPYNPRRDLQPGDPDYEKLKKSLTEFDLVEPLIWNKRSGNLVGGHQRLKILRERGDTEVEVSVVDLPDKKEKALNLALNKISGEWDFPKLKDILEELDTGAFDMEITGFDDKEIEDLMTQFHIPEEGLTPDDEIPEKVETICKTGDLWQLGDHKLLCGDATKKEDVERLMQGEKMDVLLTDPPYGDGKYETDKVVSPEYYIRFIDTCPTVAIFGYPERLIGLCVSIQRIPHEWVTWFPTNKFGAINTNYLPKNTQCIAIWGIIIGAGELKRPRVQHKAGLAIVKAKGGSLQEARLGDVWQDASPGMMWNYRLRLHPNEKPVSLLEKLVILCSNQGDIVLDPFGGSGTTLIACEKLGRRCFMMEIDEHYNDVILARWEAFTGKKAVMIDGN